MASPAVPNYPLNKAGAESRVTHGWVKSSVPRGGAKFAGSKVPPIGQYDIGRGAQFDARLQRSPSYSMGKPPPREPLAGKKMRTQIGPGQYDSHKFYSHSVPPQWSVPKGYKRKPPNLKQCGAQKQYTVDKQYCDADQVNGVLVQGGVQRLGTRTKNVLKWLKVPRDAGVPKGTCGPKVGPGSYSTEQALDRVLTRSKSAAVMPERKSKRLVNNTGTNPGPGSYQIDDSKIADGARKAQTLGSKRSFGFGSS